MQSEPVSASSSVRVAVRVRPLSDREASMGGTAVIRTEGQTVVVEPPPSATSLAPPQRSFTFDYCFDSQPTAKGKPASQADVFTALGSELIRDAWSGYNCSLFAYGVTGAGKSYSMIGTHEARGLIPRIYSALFDSMVAASANSPQAQFSIEVSFSEIYNERVKDLLNPAMGSALRVREHPVTGPYVENLSRVSVSDLDALDSVLEQGFALRATAATNINAGSSRSHAIFTMVFTQTTFDPATNTIADKVSKINLVDLAGSERVALSGAQGQQLKEAGTINKSLFYLSKVITELSDGARHISYRESVLTWLLKESLGGNAKTIMLANISPADTVLEETMSTLRYAVRASSIVNAAVVNEDPTVALINSLRSEIERLRSALSASGKPASPGAAASDGAASTGTPFKLHRGDLYSPAAPSRELQLDYASPVASMAPSTSASDFEEMRAWSQSIQRHCDDSRNLILSLMMASNGPGSAPAAGEAASPRTTGEHPVSPSLDPALAAALHDMEGGVSGPGSAAMAAAGKWSKLEIIRVYQRSPFFRNVTSVLAMDSVALFYISSSGVTQLGSELSDEDPGSIRIVGPGVLPKHATLVCTAPLGGPSTVHLWPLPLAHTAVNGKSVTSGTQLTSGDVVQFGSALKFAFHDAPLFRSSAQVAELLHPSPPRVTQALAAACSPSSPTSESSEATTPPVASAPRPRPAATATAAAVPTSAARTPARASPQASGELPRKVKLKIVMADLGVTRSVTLLPTTTVEEVCKRAAKLTRTGTPGALFVPRAGNSSGERLVLPHESLEAIRVSGARVVYRSTAPVAVHLPDSAVVQVELTGSGTVAELADGVAALTRAASSEFKLFMELSGRLAPLLDTDMPLVLLSANALQHPGSKTRIVLKRKRSSKASGKPPRPRPTPR
ncbi:uncharacterized protein AMSG_06708 [Thecamonas trahens ATCC 50062]|uniref:Kinesin-like protein n=1 Tax=Thecamonas trahens ATCC 50062 TaxID=461836 RepID=A0A0L0DF86_THETB|nr:hypothetical protein AMSG_06708 [Thecamonas trahens ATCC 50062]KNC50806.1 hypothetical protein AMSG_06708 [Thecamonas trahens ATCC 50062]|eukprot:XP_013756762.1 hypothetical protein AMSG_06708 [Thecamonas trahens ATCC 50062]